MKNEVGSDCDRSLSQTASFIMLLKHVAAGSSEAVIIAQIQTSWSKFVRHYKENILSKAQSFFLKFQCLTKQIVVQGELRLVSQV